MSKCPKFTNFLLIVDDIAVYEESKEELEEQFSLFLEIYRENHLTLSLKKFQTCDPEGFIKFAGMIMSSKGLSPDPDKMSVIQDFLIPVLKSDLHSWLGLCQHLSMWYPELASCQSGLCHLVRADVKFLRTADMTAHMESTKQLLCGDVYVLPFDTMLVPTLYVDGSILNGAGFILVQHNGRFFTHGPQRWNHGSTDGLFLLLLLLLLFFLLLHTTNFLFLLDTENTNFQTGLTFQATPVTPISSCSFSFYFLERFCTVMCCTVLYCYCIVLYSTVRYSTVRYSTILYCKKIPPNLSHV